MATNPQSPAEWLSLAAQHEAAARKLAEDRVAAAQAYSHGRVCGRSRLEGLHHVERAVERVAGQRYVVTFTPTI